MTEENTSPEQLQDEIVRVRASLDDTLDAIQHKLSPGPLMNQAWDYLRQHPGGFATNLGTRVRDNPLPVLMMGVSLAWLMASDSNGHAQRPRRSLQRALPFGLGRNKDRKPGYGPLYGEHNPYQRQEGAESGDPMAGHYEDSYDPESYRRIMQEDEGNQEQRHDPMAGRYQDPYDPRSYQRIMHEEGEEIDPEQMSESGDETRQHTRFGASRGSDSRRGRGTAGRLAGRTRGAVSGAAQGARQTAGQIGGTARQTAGQIGGVARQTAGQISGVARHQAERARGNLTYLMREQPMMLGAIGIALGAAIGAAMPSTRRENQWMGPARDDVLERAKTSSQEQLEKAQQVATEAGSAALQAGEETAKEESERQNLGRTG